MSDREFDGCDLRLVEKFLIESEHPKVVLIPCPVCEGTGVVTPLGYSGPSWAAPEPECPQCHGQCERPADDPWTYGSLQELIDDGKN